jgi:hypothetical protein
MSGETARLLERIAARAKDDPDAVLPTLRVLAGEPPYPNPTTDDLHDLAVEINRARVQADRADFVAHSWATDRVAEHLGVRSRQAVAQRRQRGSLLGATIGTQTYYPAWQFGPDGLAPDLGRLLTLLRDSGVDDTREADGILRMKHSELRGRTLLAAWRRGDWTTLETWLGDISGWRR